MTVRRRHPRRDLPDFVEALEEEKHLCLDNPGPYVDYDEDNMPTADEADELCIACPVFFLCRQNAKYRHPAYGVWGGQVWVDGKIVKSDLAA